MNTFIVINYAVFIGIALLLTWGFGRKMPMFKKITTVCALVFIFITGLPIVEIASIYLFQHNMTQEKYEWVITHPNTFFLYKNLFSLLYTMILSAIFLQRRSKEHYESCPSFIMPFILLVTVGINYLTNFILNMDVFPRSTLFNNTGIIIVFISLLTIIVALWRSNGHVIHEPRLGIVFAVIAFISYSLKFGILCFLRYTDKSLEFFYVQSTPNMLVQAVCLSFILLSGLLLLRYIAYQNPANVQFKLFTSLGGFTKSGLILISTGAVFAFTLFFLMYTPFEAQVEQLWSEESNTRRNTGKTCLSSPVGLVGDLKWTLSIARTDPNEKSEKQSYYSNELSHEQKISRLDALTTVGFLKKYEEDIFITHNKEELFVPGFRYHITPVFKAYSSGGMYPCLQYTAQNNRFIGIDSIDDLTKKFSDEDRKILKRFGISQYIKVSFLIGIEEDELFPWAKDIAVSQAFDLKIKESHSMEIAKINGTWMLVPNLRVSDFKNRNPEELKLAMKRQKQDQEQKRMYSRQNNMRSNIDHTVVYPYQIKSGNFPKQSTILSRFQKEYQSGNCCNSAWFRLDRPGSTSDLPVDIQNNLGRCEGFNSYKVGIITEQNPSLKKRDKRILNNTLPYLQNLVERGILFSYKGEISLKNQNNQSYSGLYFEPTELYQEAFSHCLDLKEPRFDLLKARVLSGTVILDTVAYYNRPSWATDEMLKNFEELRLMLEYGSTNIARNPAYDLPFKVRNTPIKY